MKTDRLYALILYLLNHGKSSASKLAKHFEVSVRTIQRDIDPLCLADIPICALIGTNGGLTATPFKRNGFYTENPPSKELQSYIRCYWGIEKPLIQILNDDAPELVIPDTCVDIIYHIDYTKNTVTGGFCGGK